MCFFVASKFNSEMQAMFCGRILPSLCSFFVVVIFAKTECYSPSNLLVRSAMYCTSATYQYQPVEDDMWHHSKHSMIILVTEAISIMPVLSLARKTSEKILPVKTITQGKSKPLVENIFSYQSSYWGMSTRAVPVLFDESCDGGSDGDNDGGDAGNVELEGDCKSERWHRQWWWSYSNGDQLMATTKCGHHGQVNLLPLLKLSSTTWVETIVPAAALEQYMDIYTQHVYIAMKW